MISVLESTMVISQKYQLFKLTFWEDAKILIPPKTMEVWAIGINHSICLLY